MTNAPVVAIPDRTADSIVGGNVRYLMTDRDIDQGTLAGIIGIDQSTLSLKLGGKRKWTVSELVTVSDAFDVSIDSLARRRDFAPAGGGSRLVGVGTTIHRFVGRTGLEPVTDGSWVAPVASIDEYRVSRDGVAS